MNNEEGEARRTPERKNERENFCIDSLVPESLPTALRNTSGSSAVLSKHMNKSPCSTNRLTLKRPLPAAQLEMLQSNVSPKKKDCKLTTTQQKKKEKHDGETQVKRQCFYCDQLLSRKQAWEKHAERKHSTQIKINFKDLKQVVTKKGQGLTGKGEEVGEQLTEGSHVAMVPQDVNVIVGLSATQSTSSMTITTSTSPPISEAVQEKVVVPLAGLDINVIDDIQIDDGELLEIARSFFDTLGTPTSSTSTSSVSVTAPANSSSTSTSAPSITAVSGAQGAESQITKEKPHHVLADLGTDATQL